MISYDKNLKTASRHLRKNMTEAEQRLWYRLRRKQILGVQFYRQKPLLDFIVDFYCPVAKLVVEVDGGQHFEGARMMMDQRRDERLGQCGLKVLRFDNRQVMGELEAVVAVIHWEVERRMTAGNPPRSPFGKGGG